MNSPKKGTEMIVAQKVNLSKVRISNAVSPSIHLGIGVVPPVPNTNNKAKDMPKNRCRRLNDLAKIYGKANSMMPQGSRKKTIPKSGFSINDSLEPCGIDT